MLNSDLEVDDLKPGTSTLEPCEVRYAYRNAFSISSLNKCWLCNHLPHFLLILCQESLTPEKILFQVHQSTKTKIAKILSFLFFCLIDLVQAKLPTVGQ